VDSELVAFKGSMMLVDKSRVICPMMPFDKSIPEYAGLARCHPGTTSVALAF
jgi:hypothetical protein